MWITQISIEWAVEKMRSAGVLRAESELIRQSPLVQRANPGLAVTVTKLQGVVTPS